MQEIKVNQLLHTKDGREIGNAIVTDVVCGRYTIMTDYGNKLKMLPIHVIQQHFFIGGMSMGNHKHYISEGEDMVAENVETFMNQINNDNER